MNNQQTVGGIIALVVILGVFGFFGYTMHQQHLQEEAMRQAVAPFEEYLGEYPSLPKPPDGDIRGGSPKKKMITIDVNHKTVDYFWFRLPPELRAATPDEVESVVWLKWGEERVAEYEGGGWAIRNTCTVTVFDLKTKKVLA